MQRSTLLLSATAVFLLTSAAAQAIPITLSNLTTRVDVYGGEANDGLVPYGGYFRYTDLGAAEETTWSVDPVLIAPSGTVFVLSNGAAGGFGSPADMGGGRVRSSATVTDPASGRGVTIHADTQLIGSNARTTFDVAASPGAVIDGWKFLFYAENDLFGFADDTTAFTGSIAGGDLFLYQYDSAAGGLTVRMDGPGAPGAALTLFGAGIWTGWGTALEGGDLSVLSANGSNFATVGDVGLALAFDLGGTSAQWFVNYDTQPEPPPTPGVIPEPLTATLGGLGLAGLALTLMRRRIR